MFPQMEGLTDSQILTMIFRNLSKFSFEADVHNKHGFYNVLCFTEVNSFIANNKISSRGGEYFCNFCIKNPAAIKKFRIRNSIVMFTLKLNEQIVFMAHNYSNGFRKKKIIRSPTIMIYISSNRCAISIYKHTIDDSFFQDIPKPDSFGFYNIQECVRGINYNFDD